MNALLTKVLGEKRKEVDTLKKEGISRNRDNDLGATRDLKRALSIPNRINLIAEIKFVSPSAGIIREQEDPISIARIYVKAGAAALSLLTDKRFFSGDIKYLPRLKRELPVPIVRKDFIIDEMQVRESFEWGADAILLIARIISRRKLKIFLRMCQSLGMAALTEVHDQNDVSKALDCGADIIGINNRDLDTFKVDLATTISLAPLVPAGHIIVSESGISNSRDVRALQRVGVQAILVGTALMKSKDMEKKARDLIQDGAIDDGQD